MAQTGIATMHKVFKYTSLDLVCSVGGSGLVRLGGSDEGTDSDELLLNYIHPAPWEAPLSECVIKTLALG